MTAVVVKGLLQKRLDLV